MQETVLKTPEEAFVTKIPLIIFIFGECEEGTLLNLSYMGLYSKRVVEKRRNKSAIVENYFYFVFLCYKEISPYSSTPNK